jgi:hypothetical protein
VVDGLFLNEALLQWLGEWLGTWAPPSHPAGPAAEDSPESKPGAEQRMGAEALPVAPTEETRAEPPPDWVWAAGLLTAAWLPKAVPGKGRPTGAAALRHGRLPV